MSGSLRTLLATFLAIATAAPLAAQAPSPGLVARVQGIDSEAAKAKLAIERLDIRVRIHGTIAETEVTARFANPGRDMLEGDFTLAMPAGSVVTGYALDIEGQMVDGVLVDQRQGRMAYEARVRQRIDPGLGEVGRDNLFRTRVFPIMPGSGRTIRLRFASPLDPRAGYVLPIRDAAAIDNFSLEVEAVGVARRPTVSLPGAPAGRWTAADGGHRFASAGRNVRLGGAIEIAPVDPAGALLTSRHPNGERFFQIADAAPAQRGVAAAPVRSVTVLWDRSLSRADDNLREEIAILRQYLDEVRPQAIDLILFDSSGVERVRVANAQAAVRRLETVRYRGATSYAVLAGERLASDACLLFSDGLVTIDRREGFRPDCPLFVLSSAEDADRAWLGVLARSAGGEAYDLTVREAGEVLIRMVRRVPRVIDVRTTGGARVDYRLLDGGEYGWRLVGRLPATGDIIMRLAGLGAEPVERIYTAPAGPPPASAGAGALWAAERVAVEAASDERDREALIALSRRYSVASSDVSFIVLETGRDYAMAKFEPPANLPPRLIDEYRQVREQMKRDETQARSGHLERVLAGWNELKQWWARRFDPPPVPKRGVPAPEEQRAGAETGPMPPPPPPPPPPPSPPPPPPAPVAAPPPSSSPGEAIVLTGNRIGRTNLDQSNPITTMDSSGAPASSGIAIEPWASDRPYIEALEQAGAGAFERVFEAQRAEHGALPAFWLDVSAWAREKGRRDEALTWLLSALELPTRNNQTLAVVADRLMRWGEVDRAIFLYERLLAAEDDRPQPRRTLALALAKRAEGAPRERARADLARAISLLTEVATTPWEARYSGIELIALMDANRLIPRYRAAGGTDVPLDPRLIALLDTDIRVLIEWNTEATDIDLWVDEPSGERAIYSNPRTAIGGRLSRDMTQGYGPEEYLLRRAPAGTYVVRANVFAADRLNPNGAQRVTARLIRDFGRPNEREELVDIELLPSDQTRERLIGRITVGR